MRQQWAPHLKTTCTSCSWSLLPASVMGAEGSLLAAALLAGRLLLLASWAAGSAASLSAAGKNSLTAASAAPKPMAELVKCFMAARCAACLADEAMGACAAPLQGKAVGKRRRRRGAAAGGMQQREATQQHPDAAQVLMQQPAQRRATAEARTRRAVLKRNWGARSRHVCGIQVTYGASRHWGWAQERQ